MKRSLVLQNCVEHTTLSNERNQLLAMEKDERKKKCLIKLIRKKEKGRVRLIFF